MRIIKKFRPHRVIKAAALAALVTVCGTDMLQDAVANGDTRTLTLHHVHSGESGTITFKRNGRYDPAALQQLNVLLQDWRRKEPTKMDPALFDIVWEVYREVGATRPIEVIGGYRSPQTNAMLRARSRGVAQMSQHTLGKAMDFFIPGVPLAKIREAGLRLQRGGVGFYPTSGSPFVHLDTGGIRHWPRMTRQQLARVFPNGKTVHIPADGKPMSGYALALAEVESRGSRPGGAGAAFAGRYETASAASGPKKNIFAALFGGGKDESDDEAETAPVSATATRPAPVAAPAAPAVVAAAPAPATPSPASLAPATPARVAMADVPLPSPRPAGTGLPQIAPTSAVVAASMAPVPVPLARPAAAGTMQVAAADMAVPMPLSRPQFPSGQAAQGQVASGLPPLIVNGSQQAPAAHAGPTLSYASAGEFVVARPQPGRAATPPVLPGRPDAAVRASAETQKEIRRLFSSPTVAADTRLRRPELHRFATFVAPPRQVIDGGFGRDASRGLVTSRFAGAAVVPVPVVAVASAAPLPRNRYSLIEN